MLRFARFEKLDMGDESKHSTGSLMKIRKFEVSGYRSLRHVVLDELGDCNTFYGPNGSGKSNILDALQTFFSIMPIAVDTAYGLVEEQRMSFREGGRLAAEFIQDEDFFARADTQSIEMAAVIEDRDSHFDNARFNGRSVDRVEIAILFRRVRPGQFGLQFKRLRINSELPGLPFSDPTIRDLLRVLVPTAFAHLGVTRTLAVSSSSSLDEGNTLTSRKIGTIPDGEVVRALFEAKNARDGVIRARFDTVRNFMMNDVGRGPFDIFINSKSKKLELVEKLSDPNPLGGDIPIDRAGHGVVQTYAIVSTILLAGSPLVAIEEPEAHLHAPTLGRQLRTILQQMVTTRKINQLFIATHSNLFDLDPTRYWDVSLSDGETHVVPKPLDEIDRLHLFEPGPAKHQIQEMLRLYGDEVVFRTNDGRELHAGEMLESLQADDDIAQAFLDALHAAAMQVTGLRAKRARAEREKAT